MKLVVTYCVDQGEDEDAQPIEHVSGADYERLDSTGAQEAIEAVVCTFMETSGHTVDMGGTDTREEFDFAEVVFEEEQGEADDAARLLLSQLEAALDDYVADTR